MLRRALLLVACSALALVSSTQAEPPASMTLMVDAKSASQRVLRARLTIPVREGPLTLVYPKWLPGEHGPTGPINDLVGLQISAAGKPLDWRRDPEDAYAFSLVVPKGVTKLDVAYEHVSATGGRGATSPATATDRLVILKWNHVVLYPRGADPRALMVSSALELPAGWSFGTALPVAKRTPAGPSFAPVSLETLIDSPVVAGAHARTVELGPSGGPAHTLHLFGDSAEALEIKSESEKGLRRLVAEAGALFGGWPYRRYRFLLSLSDNVPHGGLEHHESSDNRVWERTLIEEPQRAVRASLLPHELVHSWNGKLRRPAGLVVADYQQPYHTELLWVYEGLTSYLGEVLTARSGLRSAEHARDALALTAATMDLRAGRAWRPLADTATAAPVLLGAAREWRSWRRGLDYYPESELIWLEVDTILRRQSGGTRSLDDFCRKFHGASATGAPKVVPYSLDDVVTTLAELVPHDWRAFFHDRVEAASTRAPLGGLEAAGWKLVYRETPSAFQKLAEQATKEIDLSYSLGAVLKNDGTVVDVLPGSAAARAGVAPASKIIAVNGRRMNKDVLRAAVRATKQKPGMELIVESEDFFRTLRLAWGGGERYPALERIAGTPDLLTAIYAARAQAEAGVAEAASR